MIFSYPVLPTYVIAYIKFTWLIYYKVTEFRYIKVEYESMITWKLMADNLRCSPSFFGQPRYDGVIIHKAGNSLSHDAEYAFAQLIFVFIVVVDEHTYPLALVHLMDHKRPSRRMDKDLSLYRIRAKPRSQAMFIPVRSIVRGALLFPVPAKTNEFFVVDTVDADMYLRVKAIFN